MTVPRKCPLCGEAFVGGPDAKATSGYRARLLLEHLEYEHDLPLVSRNAGFGCCDLCNWTRQAEQQRMLIGGPRWAESPAETLLRHLLQDCPPFELLLLEKAMVEGRPLT